MTTENSKAVNEGQIRALIDERVRAIRGKDADALLSNYAAGVVMFNLAPPLQSTGADKKGAEEWFSWYRGPIHCEVRDLSITTGGDAAFCHYLYRISGTKTDGEGVDMWVRTTMGFHRIEGKWAITHEHQSVPFDMQTFKALLDLKP